MKYTIQIFENGSLILSRVIEEGVYSIGRSESCDIRLEGDDISRNHVELRLTETAIYFTNMSMGQKLSHNGSESQAGEIIDSDNLEFGSYRLVFREGEVKDSAAKSLSYVEGGLKDPASEHSGSDISVDDEGRLAPAQNNFFQPPSENNAPYAPAPDYSANAVEGTSALANAATQVHSKPLVAKIIFTEGPLTGQEIFLETYEVAFGRSKKADIFIDDAKLSRIHAKITRLGSGYRLIDMSSRNGTHVNGMRILEHPLNSYDVIQIGNSKIKFLIHDLIVNSAGGRAMMGVGDQTKSHQMTPSRQLELVRASESPPNLPPRQPEPLFYSEPKKSGGNRLRLILGAIIVGGLVYLLMPGGTTDKSQPDNSATVSSTVAETATPDTPDINVPPPMPKEFLSLSPERQRNIEGQYTEAVRAYDKGAFDDSLFYLKKIHDEVPFYKRSREMLDDVGRRIKEKEYADAKNRAERDSDADLLVYLDDGIQYLKAKDFGRAEEAFQAALNVEPTNERAKRGMRAAQLKLTSIDEVPDERNEDVDNRKAVISLFEQAVAAVGERRYQEAMELAKKIKTYKIQGDGQYLIEAQRIIDRARMLQKEEFEPFLIQSKEKFVEGAYNESRDMCEEMLKRDPTYEPAKELLDKNKKKLNMLAKENYVTGYVLESMGKLNEARQYWMRAKNYVRSGDPYYKKVIRKLEQYE